MSRWNCIRMEKYHVCTCSQTQMHQQRLIDTSPLLTATKKSISRTFQQAGKMVSHSMLWCIVTSECSLGYIYHSWILALLNLPNRWRLEMLLLPSSLIWDSRFWVKIQTYFLFTGQICSFTSRCCQNHHWITWNMHLRWQKNRLVFTNCWSLQVCLSFVRLQRIGPKKWSLDFDSCVM